MLLGQLKIYCINLERRPDRWALVQSQFAKHNLEVERFAAIDGDDFVRQTKIDPGNNGCTLSHYSLIERAKLMGFEAVIIFEDDVELADNFWFELNRCFALLPPDWDALMFGGSHKEDPTGLSHTDKLMRVARTLTTHGYIIRSTMFDAVISSYPKLENQVDGYFADLQRSFNVYVTNPPLAWQRADYSDIQKKAVDYPHLKTNKQNG